MIKLRDTIDQYTLDFEAQIGEAKAQGDKRLTELRSKAYLRWRCLNDLFFLGEFTGHSKFVTPFHKDLCDRVSLMNWNIVYRKVMPKPLMMIDIEEISDTPEIDFHNERLFLLFRSAFKTTIITKLHTLQLLLLFPEIHIAISHNTQINASDNLESVKALFLSTNIKTLFDEYIPKGNDWGNKTGFSLANRKDFIMTGDNLEAIGIGTQVVGRKYHIFKNDDIVTDESVTNEEQIKKSRDYLELHKSLFLNPSLRIEDYSGTKYHFADAYSKLESDPNVEKCIIPLEDTNGKCILPEMFSDEGIKGLKSEPYIWNCQYMLNPSDPLKTKFTEEMIQYFDTIPDGLNYYLVVDPADSEEKRACYTAMKVIGIDYDNNWYWVDGIFDKIDDRKRIDEAIRLAKKWRVFEVLWENLSFGRTDNRNFERASREVPAHERTWMVREIGASRISKDDRILGLNDRYSRRKVFWLKKMLYYSNFEGKTIDIVEAQLYEFKYFPLCSHKDLLDAESFLLQIDLIKGDKEKITSESKFSHIKDANVRGNTEVFWHDWETWKANGFNTPSEALVNDNL